MALHSVRKPSKLLLPLGAAVPLTAPFFPCLWLAPGTVPQGIYPILCLWAQCPLYVLGSAPNHLEAMQVSRAPHSDVTMLLGREFEQKGPTSAPFPVPLAHQRHSCRLVPGPMAKPPAPEHGDPADIAAIPATVPCPSIAWW